MIDPLEEPLPSFDVTAAARLMEEAFGVSGELTPLHGERDLNFRVGDAGGPRFLLKIQNPADGEEVVAMQTAALAHIAGVEPALPISRSLAALDGNPWRQVTAPDGRTSFIRLFTFLEGHHAGLDELDELSLFEWGRTVARLGRALRGFFHPAAGYPIQWDIRRAPGLRSRLVHLSGEPRELVGEVLDRFDAHVAPVIDRLRSQVIHNDMSRANVLVDERSRISGITDFGDMTHTALVCDLAVVLADVLDGRDGSVELARAMIEGYHSVTPLEPAEAAILGDLVAARCATSVALTAWRERHHDVEPEWVTGALGFLSQLNEAGFDYVAAHFAACAGHDALPYRRRPSADLLTARRPSLGPLSLSYESPLHLVRGEGVFLFGPGGERYLDAYNNVPVVGHCHEDVVRAVSAQMKLLNTNTRYLHEAGVELAERLIESAPAGLDRVLLLNSGSEANDIAWRMSCRATGGRGAIVTRFAYHGVTEATTNLSPEGWPEDYSPPDVALLAPPGSTQSTNRLEDTNGWPRGGGGTPVAAEKDAAGAIGRLAAAGVSPAAIFLDSAFTSDGILGPAHEWVRQVAAVVRSCGGLVVADEVQAGYGRTGDGLWSIGGAGFVPDLMTTGKPMGNGYPVAAVLTRAEIADPFIEETGYFSTFGGNTVACVAGLAVLRVIEEEGLVEQARSTGAYLKATLEQVTASHGSIGTVRGWGLICGLEVLGGEDGGLPDPREAARIVNRLRDLGVLVGTTGPSEHIIKIRPPLVMKPHHVDLLAERLEHALAGALR